MKFELPSPEDDGLFREEAGSWSADKHHFLRRYIHAFTTAMKDKNWNGLHYIDLFAGPGIVQIKDGPLDWGSPLIAAQSPTKFDCLHLCDKGKREFEASTHRLARFPQPTSPQCVHGDANEVVDTIVAQIPKGALSLAFLDPHGLHLHYETVRQLSVHRTDLIVFFPDHLDVLRNWEDVYQQQPNSNLDLVLGTDCWRERMHSSPITRWAELVQRIYEEQLRKLGYAYFEDERITRPNGRFLYKLIFCSAHERGAQIWRGVARQKRDGQYDLFK